jgi:hypothetical protein
MSELRSALAVFVAAYLARPELVRLQKGWSPRIRLRATDTPAEVTVRFVDGVPLVESAPAEPTLVVSSDERTLCDVLRLQLSPNEPYLFGELTVQGAEADFVRLDYIATELCPS